MKESLFVLVKTGGKTSLSLLWVLIEHRLTVSHQLWAPEAQLAVHRMPGSKALEVQVERPEVQAAELKKLPAVELKKLQERSVLQAVEQEVSPQAMRLLLNLIAPVNLVWKTLPSL